MIDDAINPTNIKSMKLYFACGLDECEGNLIIKHHYLIREDGQGGH